MNQLYPYTGWVLTSGLQPKAVEFTKRFESFSNADYGDVAASSRIYRRQEIHATKADAIAFGRAEVDRMAADLEKREARLLKKIAALNKAEAT